MHILVVRNNSNPQAIDASLLVATYLTSQGIASTVVDSSSLGNDQEREAIRRQLPHDIDLVIVLGGDGTVLHTVHLLHTRHTPILPINFGRLGFLANADDAGLIPLIADALAGELTAEQRALLSIQVVCEDERDPYDADCYDEAGGFAEEATCSLDEVSLPTIWGSWVCEDKFGVNSRGLAGIRHFFALNELALTRGSLGRIIELSLGISGTTVDHLRGDGIIVSTATGSTAYALSAGGPLVSPGFKGMIAVPLAPHTLKSRAIVTDSHDVIELTLANADAFREATLFVDGEIVPFPQPLKKIYVQRADHPVTLLRVEGTSFYERLSRDFFGDQCA